MHFVETIVQRLRDRAARPVLTEIHATGPREIHGAELLSLIAHAQKRLAAVGAKPGDRVVLIGANGAEWVAADLAILSLGLIAVPMYHRQEPREIAFMIQDCRPLLVLCQDDGLAALIRAEIPAEFAVESFAAVFPGGRAFPKVTALDPQACATIVYTSGTSGLPKGAMIGVSGVEFMLRQTVSRLKKLMRGGKREGVFHFLPFCFMGSRIMLWSQLFRGHHLWLSTDLTRLKDELAAVDPHYYMNVPAVLERIRTGVEALVAAKSPMVRALYAAALADDGNRAWSLRGALGKALVLRAIRKKIGRNLRFLICGSAPLRPETQRWFMALGIPVLQVYGLTETTAIITMDREGAVEPGYVGPAIDGCEVKLTEEGELICRGPNVFLGYWNRPEETAAILRDGWLHTGDRAERNERGNYKVLGRLKNILVSESGHNIAPEPIEESLLAACPGLQHAVVVGHAKPYLTAIVTGEAATADVARAIEVVNRDLPHYRRIRDFYRAQEPLSVEKGHLTANQKIRRKAVEAYFQAPIDEMYRRGERRSL